MRRVRWFGMTGRDFIRHLVLDVLLVTAVVVLAMIIFDRRAQDSRQAHAVGVTRTAVRLIQATLELRVALKRDSLDNLTYPPMIDPAWFEGDPPLNALLGPTHPWLEIATRDELDLRHPRDITVDGGGSAMFWYNPERGIVRARVPRTLTDAEAVSLYNEINGTKLFEFRADAATEDRE